MAEVCRALAPSRLIGKGRYVNTKPVFLLVFCPPASHLPLLEVAARAGPGLTSSSPRAHHHWLSLSYTSFTLRLEYSGRNVAHSFVFCLCSCSGTGADLIPDMTWLVRFVPFIFSGSNCCCCTFHRLCCTCSATKGGTSIHGRRRSFPLLLLGFGWIQNENDPSVHLSRD